MRLFVFIFFSLVFLAAAPAGAATYYSHPDCSDNPASPTEQVGAYDCSAHGCTDADPAGDACYIAGATALASADGDVVELADGTYLLKSPVSFPDRTATSYIRASNAGAVTVTSMDAITQLFDMTGADHWKIEGLIFDGNLKALYGIEASMSRITVHGNIFRSCSRGINAAGSPVGTGKDIQNNLIYDCTYPMVWVGNWYDSTVKNNTFVDNDDVLYLAGYWIADNEFSNNLLAWNNGSSGEQILLRNLPESFGNNNIYSDSTAADPYDYIVWDSGASPMATDASNRSFPPDFSNRAGGDYTLSSGSLLVDKGEFSGLATDLAGSPRTQGTGVDIGCFESPFTGSATYTVSSTANKVVVMGHSIAAGYYPGAGAVGLGVDATDPSQDGTPARFLSDLLSPSWTVINWGVNALHSAATPFLAYRALEQNPEWVIVGPGWINSMWVSNVNTPYIADCAAETVRVLKNAGVDPGKIILVGMIAEDSQPDRIESEVGHYTPEAFSAAEIRDAFADVALAEGVLFADVYHVFAGAGVTNWNTTFFNNVDSDIHPNVTHGYPMLGRLWYNLISFGGDLFVQDDFSPTDNEISLYPICEDARLYTDASNNGCILTRDNTAAGASFVSTGLGVLSDQQILDLDGAPDVPVTLNVDQSVVGTNGLTLNEDGNDGGGTTFQIRLGVFTKRLGVTVGSRKLGDVAVGATSVTHTTSVINEGSENLVLGTVSATGADASEFRFLTNTCTGSTLAPLETCQVQMVLEPLSAGPKLANLSIPVNDTDITLVDLPLSGTGIDPDDTDGDGHRTIASGGDDCDDTDPTVYGGAPELCDGQDNDCDSTVPPDETDDDSDGYVECTIDAGEWDGAVSKLGDDCDDGEPGVNPGAAEGPFGDPTCSDSKDNDCDGDLDGADGNCLLIPEVTGYVREDCTGYPNCYASLAAWQAAKGGIDFTGCTVGDLICVNKIAIAEIDGTWATPETTPLLIDGWTTDVTRYVRIYTTPTARHNGTWGNGYRLETSSTHEISSSHVRIEGLAFSTGTQSVDTLAVTGAGTTGVEIGYCLIVNGDPGTGWRDAFYALNIGPGNWVKLYNSTILLANGGADSAAVESYGSGTIYASNVTGVNKTASGGHVFKATAGGNIAAYNCLGKKGAGGAVFGTPGGTLSCSYCASTDATAAGFGGAGNRVNQTFSFLDEPADDYHLGPLDTGAKDFGDASDPNFTFLDDIDGETRGGAWDIGADEVSGCIPTGLADDNCDGIDDDCDGTADDEYAATPTNCGIGACASTGDLTCQSGSEVDSCVPGTAAADDSVCNAIDDDCDGPVDEEYAATPTNCGIGACASTGDLTCQDGSEVDSCVPGTAAADDSVCNAIDDDCDGPVDEEYAATPTNCGIGACASTGNLACQSGSEVDSCAPGTPAADDGTCDGIDDDCDGAVDEDYVVTPTTCGVGACAATGELTCEGGSVIYSCVPGTPAADDGTCNGVDDDCDGAEDEDYVVTPTTCGVGACASSGSTSCVAGQLEDDCTPGVPNADDATCDGLDDDCDGAVDEDYIVDDSCGVGACMATNTPSTCTDGVETPCQEGNPMIEGPGADQSCSDSVDNDCDGASDCHDSDCSGLPPCDVRMDLIVDFGESGIWVRYNDTSWTKLHPTSSDSITTGDLDGNGQDEAIIDFGSSGIWVRYNDTSWTKLHPMSADSITTGDLDGNGEDEVIIDFGSSGIWIRYNDASWTKLHPTSPDLITTGDLDGNGQDEAIIDFGSSGIWIRYNDASWTKLHPTSPDLITTGDLDGNGQDEMIVDFGSSGIWVRYNDTSWTKLHPMSADSITTGDLDGNGEDEVIIDFGSSGIWIRYNDASWTKLHPTSPDMMSTGDLDGNSHDEIIIDFGSSGIWVRYNDASWTKLHPSSPNRLTTGNMDGV